jgi:hypothetical protein
MKLKKTDRLAQFATLHVQAPCMAAHIKGLPLSLIWGAIPAALRDEAMRLAVARLELTPEKLALLIVRAVNPDECIEQGEEATLRGLRRETLKGYKDGGEYPRQINGAQSGSGKSP